MSNHSKIRDFRRAGLFFTDAPLLLQLFDANLVLDMTANAEPADGFKLHDQPLEETTIHLKEHTEWMALRAMARGIQHATEQAICKYAKPGITEDLRRMNYHGPYYIHPYRWKTLDHEGSHMVLCMTPKVIRLIVARLPYVEDDYLRCVIVPQVRIDSHSNCGIALCP